MVGVDITGPSPTNFRYNAPRPTSKASPALSAASVASPSMKPSPPKLQQQGGGFTFPVMFVPPGKSRIQSLDVQIFSILANRFSGQILGLFLTFCSFFFSFISTRLNPVQEVLRQQKLSLRKHPRPRPLPDRRQRPASRLMNAVRLRRRRPVAKGRRRL